MQVSAFQASFNSVDLDFRKEPETKAELALRSSEAQDALWDVCDERQKQNEQLAVTIRQVPISMRQHGWAEASGNMG